jgi:S1-C subfamily serine protease
VVVTPAPEAGHVDYEDCVDEDKKPYVRVSAGGDAADGLRKGDVIERINGVPVPTIAALDAIEPRGGRFKVTVMRDGQRMQINLNA